MNTRYLNRHGCRQSGFTLVEALVALVVMAFGMLAIAGFQITMSRGSEVAKQRSEAVRLAELKIEELRSFETVVSDGVGGRFDYVSDVVGSGANEILDAGTGYTTNTQYRRSWAVTRSDGTTAAGGTDSEKWINVLVTWNDRTGQQHEVRLRSIISRSDPIDLGILYTGQASTKTRTPKNRNVNIPYPAVTLGGGKSGFQPPGSSYFYVFDNGTGEVLGWCPSPLGEGLSVTADFSSCGGLAFKGYLLSGYIRFLNSVPTSGTERNIDNAISNPTTATRPLSAFVDPLSGQGVMRECATQQQRVVSVGNVSSFNISSASRSSSGVVTITTSSNHGMQAGQVVSINGVTPISDGFDGTYVIVSTPTSRTITYSQTGLSSATATGNTGFATLVQELTMDDSATAPPAPPGYTTVVSRFVAYTCIIEPLAATPDDVWSGYFRITPDASWSLGTSAGTYKMCRFTGDYFSDNVMSNSEHPLYYRGVTGALDNQNYLVVPHSESCPTDSETDPLNDDYINTHTILHQNSATSPYGGTYSVGTQWGGGSAGEPMDTTTLTIPMLCPTAALCPL